MRCKGDRPHDGDAGDAIRGKAPIARGRDIEDFVEKNSAVKEGISPCYAVRNSVAHGGGQSLGPRRLLQYYDTSFMLVAQPEFVFR
jgi:hypothetical protein